MKRIDWMAPAQLDCGGMHTLAPFYSWDQSVISDIKKYLESVLYTCQEIDISLENLINTCRTVPNCDPKKSSSVVPTLGDDSFDEDIISVSASTTQAGVDFANVAGQLFDSGPVLSQGSAGLLGNVYVCLFLTDAVLVCNSMASQVLGSSGWPPPRVSICQSVMPLKELVRGWMEMPGERLRA